jgi:ABC-2 type transport system ATP-binding protein
MDEAEALADELVIIDHGKIVASGTPAEVTSKGAEGQLRLTTVPGLSLDSLAGSLAGFRIEESNPGTYVVEGAIDPATVATVATWCADQDVLINDIRVDQRSLEDVFLELTGRELRG